MTFISLLTVYDLAILTLICSYGKPKINVWKRLSQGHVELAVDPKPVQEPLTKVIFATNSLKDTDSMRE